MIKWNPVVNYLESTSSIPIKYKDSYIPKKDETLFKSEIKIKNEFDKKYESKVDFKNPDYLKISNENNVETLTKEEVKKIHSLR
jgi:hypothetical protein